MTDLLEIPEFLRRDPTAPTPMMDRAMRNLHNPYSRDFVMPNTRIDPRRQQMAEAKREIPSRDKAKNRTGETTGQPIVHPTTIAIKAATSQFTGEDKRMELYSIAIENGIIPSKWDRLNVGQVAMNLTNVLRGRYYKMQPVTVNGKEIP
jgi:hypothetical protein